jgi:hypothetical protein
MLFRLGIGTTDGRCSTGREVASPYARTAARLDEEPLSLTDEGGVEVPFVELKVEDDLAVGTVPLDSLEESEVRKLALERLRSSLKNGIFFLLQFCNLHLGCEHGVGSPDVRTGVPGRKTRVRSVLWGDCKCAERETQSVCCKAGSDCPGNGWRE